jgi:hypothetical protein
MFATSLGLLKHGIKVQEQMLEDEGEGRREKGEGKKEKGEGRKQKAERKKEANGKGLPRKKDANQRNIWDSIKGFLDELTEKTS